jgi:hypothetical protein
MDKDELFGEGGDEPRSILSKEEIEKARKLARERVEKALKEAETERVIAQEMARMRAEEGKRTGKADLDEEVKVTVDLAEFAAKLVINGQEYWHGYTYTVPRHVYDSMRDIMFRGHVHQAHLDGKDPLLAYRTQSAPALSGGEKA